MLKLIAVAVLLAACGDNLPGISLDDYAASSRDAACAHAVTCGEVVDIATCRTTALGNPGHITASLRAAVEAGTITFDGAAAEACNEALASRSCDVTSQSSRVAPAACAAVLVGTVDAGGGCAQNDECLSQLCDLPICTGGCCAGLCVGSTPPAHAKLGESCEVAPCDDTAYCDDALLCDARKGVGGAARPRSAVRRRVPRRRHDVQPDHPALRPGGARRRGVRDELGLLGVLRLRPDPALRPGPGARRSLHRGRALRGAGLVLRRARRRVGRHLRAAQAARRAVHVRPELREPDLRPGQPALRRRAGLSLTWKVARNGASFLA